MNSHDVKRGPPPGYSKTSVRQYLILNIWKTSHNNGYLIDNINIRLEIIILKFHRVIKKTLAKFNVNEKPEGLHEH